MANVSAWPVAPSMPYFVGLIERLLIVISEQASCCRCGTYLSYLCEYTKAGWVPIANIAPFAHQIFPWTVLVVSWRRIAVGGGSRPLLSTAGYGCLFDDCVVAPVLVKIARALHPACLVQGAHGAESPPLLPALEARSTDQFRAVASVTGAHRSLWRVDSVENFQPFAPVLFKPWPFGSGAFIFVGLSLSIAAVVSCECLASFHHEHLVGLSLRFQITQCHKKMLGGDIMAEAHRECFHLVKLGDLASSAECARQGWKQPTAHTFIVFSLHPHCILAICQHVRKLMAANVLHDAHQAGSRWQLSAWVIYKLRLNLAN